MDVPNRRERSGGLGGAGERLVASWLEARGLRVVARNWRCPYGEIDLIAEEHGELVFVEVKTRRGTALGAPEEAITPRKRHHLIAAAQTYLAELDMEEERPYRIDVVAVQLSPSGKLLDIRHYPSAVALEE
jgi:putative endonuclease